MNIDSIEIDGDWYIPPDWAEYYARDYSGGWWWHQCKPIYDKQTAAFISAGKVLFITLEVSYYADPQVFEIEYFINEINIPSIEEYMASKEFFEINKKVAYNFYLVAQEINIFHRERLK